MKSKAVAIGKRFGGKVTRYREICQAGRWALLQPSISSSQQHGYSPVFLEMYIQKIWQRPHCLQSHFKTQLGEFAAWPLSQGVCALVGGWMHATVIHLFYVKRKFDEKLCQEKSGKVGMRSCALRLGCEQATSLVRQGSELQGSGNNHEHSASPIPKLLSHCLLYFNMFLYGL